MQEKKFSPQMLGLYSLYKPIFRPRWVNIILDYLTLHKNLGGFLKCTYYPLCLLMKSDHEQAEVATMTDRCTVI